jgi:hypothetical protein
VTPARERVASGNEAQFHATAILSSSLHVDVTGGVQWISGDPRIAQATSTPGEFDTLQPGRVTISASLLFIVNDVTIHVGETAQLQVTGVFAGGCEQDLTHDSATVWDSGDRDVFTIGNKTGSSPGSGRARRRWM